MNDIQEILESFPAPGGSGTQISLHLNRLYPEDSDHRFVVRVKRKNFTGNDIVEILLKAKKHYDKSS